MKVMLVAVAATLLFATPALAERKSCDELKSEIEEKIKKNGVATFSLDVVAKGEEAKAEPAKDAKDSKDAKDAKPNAGEGSVVGTCDGGAKQIVYKRG